MKDITESKGSDSRISSSILIVDDLPANLLLLEKMFSERGYKTRTVSKSKMALQVALDEVPDLILLDINMPEMNGYELCAQLKANAVLKDIPVIFISAMDGTIDKVKAFNTGGVDYVTNPFQLEEVEARVYTHLELRRIQIELENRNRQLEENCEKLKKLEDLQDKLTQMLVHDMRSSLIDITGYLETLEVDAEKKLDSNEMELLRNAITSGVSLVGKINSLMDVSVVWNRGRAAERNAAENDPGKKLDEGS
ncbi:MAG TPA: hypothetical protein DET40_15285 [Lentisphaeria bacterium]|nr:MAG: hypothetical protein A2X45_05255 [Lentisphaerae bacterium GWF2_50_93]HCE44903.1 hypothetical protein [Lentisphaeria bacterium]